MESTSCKNGSKISKMAPKWSPNASPEASKWTRRLQEDSRRFQEVPSIPKMAQRGPKMVPKAHNMTPRGPKMAPKGSKMAPRWSQEASKGAKMDAKIELSMLKKH